MGYGRLLRETRPTAELPRGACTLFSIDAREYVTRDVINSHNSHRRNSESNSQRARMILLALLHVSFASFYLCLFSSSSSSIAIDDQRGLHATIDARMYRYVQVDNRPQIKA